MIESAPRWRATTGSYWSGLRLFRQRGANATAQTLTLTPLTVPNGELRGLNANKSYVVNAVAVTGQISATNGQSESDVYKFTGKAGDRMTSEVQSASTLAHAASRRSSTARARASPASRSGRLVSTRVKLFICVRGIGAADRRRKVSGCEAPRLRHHARTDT